MKKQEVAHHLQRVVLVQEDARCSVCWFFFLRVCALPDWEVALKIFSFDGSGVKKDLHSCCQRELGESCSHADLRKLDPGLSRLASWHENGRGEEKTQQR